MGAVSEVTIKQVLAALNWPDDIAGQLKTAYRIQGGLTDNPDFPIPYPADIVTLAQLGIDILAVEAAQASRLTNAPGSAAALHNTLKVVHTDLVNQMTMVQNKMDADPANAIAICERTGFDVKLQGSHPLRGDTAKPGNNPGEVFLTGFGKGMHQWQMSPDDGTTITPMDPTPTGTDHLTGLPSLTRLWFRNRQVLPHGQYGPWSQWIMIVVP